VYFEAIKLCLMVQIQSTLVIATLLVTMDWGRNKRRALYQMKKKTREKILYRHFFLNWQKLLPFMFITYQKSVFMLGYVLIEV